MDKIKKRNLLLTLTAFMLAILSAACIFMIAPHSPAKADEPVIDFSTWDVVEYQAGYNLADTYLIITEEFMNTSGDMMVSASTYFWIVPGAQAVVINSDYEVSCVYDPIRSAIEDRLAEEFPEAEMVNAMYIPTVLNENTSYIYEGSPVQEMDLSNCVSTGDVDGVYLLMQSAQANDPTEPDTPDEPSEPSEPEQPDNPSEKPVVNNDKKVSIVSNSVFSNTAVKIILGMTLFALVCIVVYFVNLFKHKRK